MRTSRSRTGTVSRIPALRHALVWGIQEHSAIDVDPDLASCMNHRCSHCQGTGRCVGAHSVFSASLPSASRSRLRRLGALAQSISSHLLPTWPCSAIHATAQRCASQVLSLTVSGGAPLILVTATPHAYWTKPCTFDAYYPFHVTLKAGGAIDGQQAQIARPSPCTSRLYVPNGDSGTIVFEQFQNASEACLLGATRCAQRCWRARWLSVVTRGPRHRLCCTGSWRESCKTLHQLLWNRAQINIDSSCIAVLPSYSYVPC
jgi:hypothetical protein